MTMTAAAFQQITRGKVDPNLIEWLGDQVGLVEIELSAMTESASELATKVGRHTLRSGGKRLRPAFVLAAAKATGLPFDEARARRFGAIMETIHMATLIHDDVIDESPIRRGQPTAHKVFGTVESVLAGDVLLARATGLLAADGDVQLLRIVSDASVEVAEGELMEQTTRGDFDLEEELHLKILKLKTASFIRACCEVGARLAGASEPVVQALREYGDRVGLAFQIADDLLDYRGRGEEMGKPQALDFRDGQSTLPLIRLRQTISEQETRVLQSRFGNGVSDDEVRMICGWMETRGAFQEVESVAANEIRLALKAIQILPSGPAKDLLAAVADFVTDRRV